MSYLRPGAVLQSRYEILAEIGRGGYSLVYRARDRELDTEVAIKLLVPPPAMARVARERMRREVMAARRLNHPNIVVVHDFAEDGEHTFMVMEYVAGPDLAVRVRDRGPLSTADAVRLGQEIAAALSHGHHHGVLHRDIKPQNILLDPDGRARLTDFGSARLDGQATVTATGAAVGTLDYMAPEVFRGQRGDARSDLYSLGLTLYYAVVGRLPARTSPHLPPAPEAGGLHMKLVQSDVPPWLDATIARLTTAQAGDRYPSASVAADVLASTGANAAETPRLPPGSLDFCLVCGTTDPLGLGLCALCAAATTRGNEVSLLLHPPASAMEREDRRNRVRSLVGHLADSVTVNEVVEGRQVLARIPAGGSERVLQRLATRGVPARASEGRWVPLPGSLVLVGATMIGTGIAAGLVTTPLFFWMSPILAGLLLADGQRRIRRPALGAPATESPFGAPAAAALVETFASLPEGPALELLGDIARNVHALKIHLASAGGDVAAGDEAEALLVHACAAARDLAHVDAHLADLEGQKDRFKGGLERWADMVSDTERTRDRLVQRLLDALASLGRSRTVALGAAEAARANLGEINSELEREVAAFAAGVEEVESLLKE